MAPYEIPPKLYLEMKRIAANQMKSERNDHTLQPTALVHEAYLKLARSEPDRWNSESHFLATAARAMRQVLIDHARKHKRRVRLSEELAESARLPREVDFLVFDEALDALAVEHARAADVISFRFILGLTVIATAGALEISERTVKGDSRLGLAWLRRRLANS
jgi:RNA polymerase sigma-70 factor (ECF subfamily)